MAKRVPTESLAEVCQRLMDSGLRLHQQRSEAALHECLIREATETSGARRVMLVLQGSTGRQIAGASLPAGEEASALLRAITPWLDEADASRVSCLRHGPEGAAIEDQRSCLVAPLIAQGQLLCHLYADIDGTFGRFGDTDRELLARLAAQAAVALVNLRHASGLEAQVATHTADLRQAMERQTATSEILRVISSSPTDVQPVFEAIVGTAVQHLGCDLALVQTVSGDTYSPRAMATPVGLMPVPGAQVMPVDPSANFPSRAIRSKAMLHIPDWTAADLPPHEQVRHQQLGLNSALYLPLVRGEACVGVLVLGSRQANAFHPKAIALAESFRDQALIAVENVRLFNETREALEQQKASSDVLEVISQSMGDSAPVFEAILERCEGLIEGTVGTTIDLVEDDGRLHRRHFRFTEAAKRMVFNSPAEAEAAALRMRALAPTPVAATRRMAEAGNRIIVHPDTLNGPGVPKGVRAFAEAATGGRMSYATAAAPMFKDGRFLGTIAVARARLGDFDPRERALLEMFARQAVVALENARLFREMNEALERQTATAEVLQVISSSVADTAPVFNKIISSCESLFAGAFVNIGLVGEDGLVRLVVNTDGVLRATPQERASLDRLLADFPRPVRESVHGYVIHKRQVVHFPDVLNGAGVPEGLRRSAEIHGNYSVLYAPMFWQGRGIGALAVNRFPPSPFTERDISLIKTFADQAVVAIQNAQMFRETNEALERQTASAEVLTVIGQSVSDAAPVFERILNSARGLLGTNYVNLGLIGEDGLMHLTINQELQFPGDALYEKVVEALRRGTPAPVHETVHGYAAHKRKVVHYPDVLNGADVPPQVAGDGQVLGGPLRTVRAAGLAGQGHRCLPCGAGADEALHRQGNRAAQDLRRPGGDRDPERLDVPGDQGGAGAADGHRRGAQRHQCVGVRCAAGVRGHREQLPHAVQGHRRGRRGPA